MRAAETPLGAPLADVGVDLHAGVRHSAQVVGEVAERPERAGGEPVFSLDGDGAGKRAAERALELMCKRASSRVAFGKTVAQQTVTQERIAEARCKIDMARLLTLKAAWLMDVAGNKVAKTEIAMIKVVAPSMACQVIDWAMQAHGGGGMSDDFPLAYAYAGARTLRFADGPDEVHRNAIAKWELGKYGSYGRDAGIPITRGA